MEKTIKEWLETLPEPYRSEALENSKGYKLKFRTGGLVSALFVAFTWSATPQGYLYWINLCDRAEAGEFNNNSLDKDSEK